MKVKDLIATLSELSHTGEEEVVLVKTDGHDNPFTDGSYTITVGKTDECGNLLDVEDESGENVILIG